MIVNDILLSVREKIGDKDRTNYRWSDEELIDAINSSLCDITQEINPWDDGEWIIPLQEGQNRYELPPYFHKLKFVKINKNIIDKSCIVGYDTFIKSGESSHVVSISINNFHIKPVKKDDVVVVYYDRQEQIAYIKDKINLPDSYKDAIVFYVCHLLNQSPVRKDGDQKSITYLNLYEKKIAKLRESAWHNKHSKVIRSTHVRF